MRQDGAAEPAGSGDGGQYRILHIGKFHPPYRGGMETYLEDLLVQQRGSGIDARALVHGAALPEDPPWLTRLRVHLHLIFTPVALGFPRAIARSLKTFRPDVLHLHMPNVAVFWLLLMPRARRIPWVVHWHSDVVFTRRQWRLALAYQLYAPFERAVLAQAQYIIATSPPYLQASLALRPWRGKCVAIPLGLRAHGDAAQTLADASQPVPDAAGSRDRNASATLWQPGRLRVLSVGRLTYYKGFETLVRAVCGMPGVQLLILGGGDLQPRLQALIDQLSPAGERATVELLGSVSEARKLELLASCEVFALASRERTEAFGLALVEAMQFGKPCVVSDLPGSGMPWLIRESGAGLCVPLEDVQAWRGALARMQGDAQARRQFGRAGAAAAQQLFSISTSGSKVSALYSAVLPENRQATRDLLVIIPAAATARPEVLESALQFWRGLEAGDLLLVCGGVATARRRQDIAAIAGRHGAAVIHSPRLTDRLNSIQTGTRWALRHGYRHALSLPAAGALEPQAWPVWRSTVPGLLHAGEAGDADLLCGVPHQSASFSRRMARLWFHSLTGLHIQPDFDASLQLYSRRAMSHLMQTRDSLLDVPEISVPMMLRQAGLSVVELPQARLALLQGRQWGRNWWRSLCFVVAGTVMHCAKWRARFTAGERH